MASDERVWDERIAELNARLAEAVGDESLCTISRAADGAVPGAKYLEGSISALREARRGIGRDVDETAALKATLISWREHLEQSRARRMGSDWLAYRAGGVDELERFIGEAS